MATETFAVTMTSTLDLPTIMRRLNAAELKIIREGGDRIVRKIKARWIGWRYESAPKDKRGRSRAGWRRTLTSNTEPVTLTIHNGALDYYRSKPYVQYVARRQGATPEYALAFADVKSVEVPALRAALTTAILGALNEPGNPRRVRANKASDTVTRTLT